MPTTRRPCRDGPNPIAKECITTLKEVAWVARAMP